ncbi:MAG: DUF4190 domain-containing protein [Microbacterium sp.]
MSTPDPQNQPPTYSPPPAGPTGYQAPPATPGYAAPAAPAAPAYVAPENVPGKGLAIAGLILAFVAPLIGLILSLVARSKLRKAGAPTGLATAGFWLGLVFTIIGAIVLFSFIALFANIFAMCAELGPGVWEINGTTYTCG